MNSKLQNYKYENTKIIKNLDAQQINKKYKKTGPNITYLIPNQENQKNIQYFPIATQDTFTGQQTIYLAAEDNTNLNDNVTSYEYKYNYKNKTKNENKILLPQRSIELKIQKTKFEYLLNFPVKNDLKNNIDFDYLKSNNTGKNKNSLDNIYSIKEEEELEEDNKNYKDRKSVV